MVRQKTEIDVRKRRRITISFSCKSSEIFPFDVCVIQPRTPGIAGDTVSSTSLANFGHTWSARIR